MQESSGETQEGRTTANDPQVASSHIGNDAVGKMELGSSGQNRVDSDSDMDEEDEGEEEGWTKDSLASSTYRASVKLQKKGYRVQNVKHFLKVTKNMKNMKIEDFFPDKKLFLLYVISQLGNKGRGDYTDKEVYKLRKMVAKLKQEFNNDEEYDGI